MAILVILIGFNGGLMGFSGDSEEIT